MAYIIEKSYTEPELAYCAGIIDGEGYLGAMRRTRTHDCFSVRAMVGNTNKGLIDWLVERFGGKSYVKHGPFKNCKACWNVFWDGERAGVLLGLIYPYLRIKREQARLIRNYLVIRGLAKHKLGVKQKFSVLPKGMHTLRDLTHSKLKSLNALGASWRS